MSPLYSLPRELPTIIRTQEAEIPEEVDTLVTAPIIPVRRHMYLYHCLLYALEITQKIPIALFQCF